MSTLHTPAGNDFLAKNVDKGFKFFWPALKGSVDDAEKLIQDYLKGEWDVLGFQWQRDAVPMQGPSMEWNEYRPVATVNDFGGLPRILSSLTVDPQRIDASKATHNVNSQVYPHGRNILLKYVQNKQYAGGMPCTAIQAPISYPATEAFYENYFNIIDGVIIITGRCLPVEDALAKANRSEEPSPYYSSLCDLLWDQWVRLHRPGNQYLDAGQVIQIIGTWMSFPHGYTLAQLGGMIGYLNYVVLVGQQPKDTVDIIVRCLQSRGYPLGYIPLFDKLPANRQGQTFGPGHWAFYALLATAPSRDMAWMLLQSKNSIDRTPRSVTIFATDPAPNETETQRHTRRNFPALLWELAENTNGLVADAGNQGLGISGINLSTNQSTLEPADTMSWVSSGFR